MKINTQKSTSSVAQNYETGKFKLYSQLNLIAKESVDLCSFWKVATLEKGGVWGA